jgi:hypothetical protein
MATNVIAASVPALKHIAAKPTHVILFSSLLTFGLLWWFAPQMIGTLQLVFSVVHFVIAAQIPNTEQCSMGVPLLVLTFLTSVYSASLLWKVPPVTMADLPANVLFLALIVNIGSSVLAGFQWTMAFVAYRNRVKFASRYQLTLSQVDYIAAQFGYFPNDLFDEAISCAAANDEQQSPMRHNSPRNRRRAIAALEDRNKAAVFRMLERYGVKA